MFERLRHYDSNSDEEFSYPQKCGRHRIDMIRDLTVGVIVDFKNGGVRSKPKFPSSKSSEMITFYFENGCIMTIRTSGTEPKIKWYSEIKQMDKAKY
jgi:phosphoglucomutase/phosphopentomutase